MLLSALLAVAALADAPATHSPAPQMRVVIRDLDFDRREDIQTFVDRTRAASRDYCARHIAFVTPDRQGNPDLCEEGMAWLTVRAMPQSHRTRLIRSGLGRRLR